MTTTQDSGSSRFSVALARTEAEVQEAQALRYDVFAQECGAQLSAASHQRDVDRFDAYCSHLLVRDNHSGRVVGTYRLLEPHKAFRHGGFYVETEFDVSRLQTILPRTVEIGRSCVHPDYRRGAVMTLLWGGLAQFVLERGYEYVMGCASAPFTDDRAAARATTRLLLDNHLSPEHWRVVPYRPFTVGPMGLPSATDVDGSVSLPPLIKGYLRIGAAVCGSPAHDPLFKTIDFLMLLPMAAMTARYARHYTGSAAASLPRAA
ncbi:MAG: GNAT family N-acyltransferase [Nitrospiraceae bacterium]